MLVALIHNLYNIHGATNACVFLQSGLCARNLQNFIPWKILPTWYEANVTLRKHLCKLIKIEYNFIAYHTKN